MWANWKEIETRRVGYYPQCDKDQNQDGRERMDVRDVSEKNQKGLWNDWIKERSCSRSLWDFSLRGMEKGETQ